MRTTIEVPDEIIQSLDQVCESEGRSRAVIIREAITEYLCHKTAHRMKAAFGLWEYDPKDGLRCQKKLCSDWKD